MSDLLGQIIEWVGVNHDLVELILLKVIYPEACVRAKTTNGQKLIYVDPCMT